MFNSKHLAQIEKETGKSYGKVNNSDRAKELEDAVSQYLKLKKIHFMRVDNYRCFKCGQVQNVRSKGWPDFYCYGIQPHLAIECKTGKAVLSPEQKHLKAILEMSKVKYIVLRDNIDGLIEYLESITRKK